MVSMNRLMTVPPFLLFLLLCWCCYGSTSTITSNSTDGGNSDPPPVVRIGCPVVESIALLQFKAKLDDPSGILSSWDTKVDCCSWKGISCDTQTGRVTSVDLHNNNPTVLSDVNYDLSLSGEIDPSLLSLQSLQHLDLRGNDFGCSPFPNFIGSFEDLRYLNLSATNLVGSIPSRYGNLSNLRYLDLSFNQKIDSALPEWLFQLSSLEHLDLKFTISDRALSDQIGGLRKLRFLDLSSNELRGSIPESLGNLSFLEEIHLEDNTLSGPIPKSLGRLSSTLLQVLDLSDNVLTGPIPEWFGGLSSLRYLYLSSNMLSSSIPDVLGSLSSLQYLSLTNNKLTDSIPPSIGNLTSLHVLNLSNNDLGGIIPPSIGNLTSLQVLDLSKNDLGGTIPPSLCGPSFTSFDLSLNKKMNGIIPECIWDNRELKTLGLGGSGLKGVLLESHFSNLSRLEELTVTGSRSVVFNMSPDWIPPFSLSLLIVDFCKIGPEFPRWLKTQESLFYLSMKSTELEGNLPVWMWNFSSRLSTIDLSSNQLSGRLPGVVYAPALADISMGFNNFEGCDWFSGVWKMMPVLQFLSLTDNNMNGTVPSSLCRINYLVGLDLSANNFSGRIPGCLIEKVQNHLNLGSNNLHGPFPSSNGGSSQNCSLKSLHLADNHLSGSIPISFSSCRQIILLDLAHNMFTGNIPNWFGSSLPALMILLLHSNLFFGDIPPQLSSIAPLQVLDLSQNNLSGKIPGTFGNFTAMAHKHMKYEFAEDFYSESISIVTKGSPLRYTTLLSFVTSIDLSSNGLSGEIPEELGVLFALVNLNLSSNRLTGRIPNSISRLQELETLDLSVNLLSGGIPPTMSTMTALNHLNLSFNNLSGSIPIGNQFQTFTDPSIFMGNPNLCGFPLKTACDDGKTPVVVDSGVKEDMDDKESILILYLSIVIGIIFGFWAFYGTLFFNRTWRNSYFQLLEDVDVSLYVKCNRQIKRLFR